MHSGLYTAYSGLKAQMDALDMLANNLANVNTTGFKEQRTFNTALNLAMDSSADPQLDSAINTHAVLAQGALDLRNGSLLETGRDLDVAIVGNGLLTVETPRGLRYTRDGNLTIDAKSVLCTSDGFPVLGENGRIVLGPGKVSINQDGEVALDGVRVDRLKLAVFDSPASLTLEGSSLIVPSKDGPAPKPAQDVTVRQGFQEQSNVNPMTATVRMVELMRNFEAIQKSVNLMCNDLDAKAIDKLSR